MLQNVSIISFASFIIFSAHLILQTLFFNGHCGITINLINRFKMLMESRELWQKKYDPTEVAPNGPKIVAL